MPEQREKPEYCDFCDVETEALTWYVAGEGGWLCLICASTPAGNVALHPGVHQQADVDVLKTLVRVGHMILAELGKKP